jgi:hypothetical protein
MNFEKYTLYSCYGTTANCNTYPVAFRILFGNEDKEGWKVFWNFAKSVHLSIDDTRVTIITDQAKGLTELIADVLPSTGHFHCSYHRHQNILKFVKRGSQKYSCLWLYNKLMKAKTTCEIEQIKHKHAPFVSDKALKYLNALEDAAQYPAARVALDYSRIIMYQHSPSSDVESMDRANKAARDRTAVDVVCATKLLLSLSAKRYQEKKEMAWKWQGHLTPYSETFWDAGFEYINF